MKREGLVTLRTFEYPIQAHIYKGKLESAGIKAFLFDEHTIGIDPLLSQALGGVKLKVYKSDESQARSLLGEISPYIVADDGTPRACPNCGAAQLVRQTSVREKRSLLFFLIGLFTSSLPIVTHEVYRCENCAFEYKAP